MESFIVEVSGGTTAERRIMDLPYGQKNGVDEFGYYSAEGEPIWMKSGAL